MEFKRTKLFFLLDNVLHAFVIMWIGLFFSGVLSIVFNTPDFIGSSTFFPSMLISFIISLFIMDKYYVLNPRKVTVIDDKIVIHKLFNVLVLSKRQVKKVYQVNCIMLFPVYPSHIIEIDRYVIQVNELRFRCVANLVHELDKYI